MKNIIIIGAGEGGKRLTGEILRSGQKNIVGILDDNLKLKSKNLLGIKILGPIKNLKSICQKTKVDEVIIAIPSLRGSKLAHIVELIQKENIPFKILPGIFESIEFVTKKQVPFGKLRRVDLSDLLDRDQIKIELEKINNYIKDKVIFIVGAGGSIGSEIARQIVGFEPQKLILIDIYENNLYELYSELGDSKVEPVICDIKDQNQLERVFKKYRPQIIFHAAAHKHVPLMEKEPQEAIKNNIFGSHNLITLTIKYKLERFVFISTDKAVNPTSIMGATKRFTEMEIISSLTQRTIFAIVRFGNVLGSFGSVIPLWKKQLSMKKPLTVTHPQMQRFFMTISEAAQLVIQAGAMAKASDIFVLKMGKQYKIVDLAYNFIKLSGFVPQKDVQIVFTHPRPGEKLTETLNEASEILVDTDNKNISKIIPKKKVDPKLVEKIFHRFHRLIDQLSKDKIIENLQEVIPTYLPYQELMKPKKQDKIINFSPPQIDEEEIKAVNEVLRNGWLTMGPKVIEFENKFAKFHKINDAIAVNSATAGLHLALTSLGVGAGDEVILPSYTFASCANTVVWTGARPVFTDISKEGFLIDPTDIEKKITQKTKAIMVVHFGGQMAEMDEIMRIAKKNHLNVIEDCAHAPGASFEGKLAGTIGDIGVFSFYATKNMTTGEGGMIITNHKDLAGKMKILRLHGMSADAFNRYSDKGKWYYEINEAGFKYNMTDLEAAMGLVQLEKLPTLNKQRAIVAEQYLKNLQETDLTLPQVLPDRKNVWHLFPILVDPAKRDLLIEKLGEFNISTSVHFIPLHLQPFYQKKFGYKKGDLSRTEEIFAGEISLPIHPRLEKSKVEYICDVIKYFLQNEELNGE